MKLCYSKSEAETKKLFSKESGFKGYLGTNDFRTVRKMIEDGNKEAKEIFDAYTYQIAKEIGSYVAALKGNVDGIIITGGCAYADSFIAELRGYVESFAEFHVYPGENEIEALAAGAFRVIDKKEDAKEYV